VDNRPHVSPEELRMMNKVAQTTWFAVAVLMAMILVAFVALR
jgi:hypothetical protein